jgi:hypothetical protein
MDRASVGHAFYVQYGAFQASASDRDFKSEAQRIRVHAGGGAELDHNARDSLQALARHKLIDLIDDASGESKLVHSCCAETAILSSLAVCLILPSGVIALDDDRVIVELAHGQRMTGSNILHVLDSCRIGWGRVVSVDAGELIVDCQPLVGNRQPDALSVPLHPLG